MFRPVTTLLITDANDMVPQTLRQRGSKGKGQKILHGCFNEQILLAANLILLQEKNISCTVQKMRTRSRLSLLEKTHPSYETVE